MQLATSEDLTDIMRLISACIVGMNHQQIDQWDEVYPNTAVVEDAIAEGSLWLFRQGGDLLGSLTLDAHLDRTWEPLSWQDTTGCPGAVHRVMVHPQHQGQGHARRLMMFAEEQAKRDGFTSLRLDAFTQNPAALALYASLGYRSVGRVVFRKGEYICFEKFLR
jgi:GNAT superfamily N-acetyltransferase